MVVAVIGVGKAETIRAPINIVAVNGYNDVIEVIQSRVEDCQLPVDSCDVIISEWMGFYLLHEAMLESVIFARDKWLSTDGLMIPSTATMWLCPVNAKQFIKENLTVWDNLYGFDYSPFKALVQEQHSRQPSVLTLTADNCIAQPQQVLHLVLKYVDEQDVQLIKRDLEFKVNKPTLCHGFAAWFDCGFDADDVTAKSATTTNAVTLSTAPNAPPTHWQQTVLILPDTLMLSKDDTIGCALTLQQDSTNHRHYNISIELMDDAEDASDVSESEADSRNEDATQIIEKLIAGKMAATN